MAGSSPKPKRTTRRGRGRRSKLLLDGDEGEANPAPAALGDSAASARDVGRDLADAPHARAREELKRATLGPPGPDAERVEGLYIAAGADARRAKRENGFPGDGRSPAPLPVVGDFPAPEAIPSGLFYLPLTTAALYRTFR